MKSRKKKAGAIIISALAVLMVSLGFIHYNDEKNVKISDFTQKINLAEYNTLTDNSASNKIIVSAKSKKEIKKLKGVKDITKSNNLYFVTFDTVKNSDNAYEKLKNKKISVNKDLKVSVQDNEESSETVSKITNNEKGTKVAVIDTGVNGAGESYDVTGEGTDDLSGHGTEMAKIIEETSDNGANIISIKAFDKNGDGSIASLYAAIELAKELDVKVINLSATTGYKVKADYVVNAIKEATKNGIKVICAAGNYSADVKDFATASVKEADVVSAVDENGDFAAYSNYGETVDYSALGTYGNDNGTSIATARVTGYYIKYGADLEKQGKDLGDDGWDKYFGNATFGVDAEEGKLPEDGFESVLFHGDWKKLSDEDFKNAIKNAKETKLSVWLNSLNEEDLKLALSKDSMLNWNHYQTDENGKRINETTYAKWLMSFNITDAETMAVLDSKTGSLPVTINDYNTGSTTTLFTGIVHSSVPDKKGDKQRTVTWSVTSMINSCNVGVKRTNKTSLSGKRNWSIFTCELSYNKPDNRYAEEVKTRAYNSDTTSMFISNVNNTGVTRSSHSETVTLKMNAVHLGMNLPSGQSQLKSGSYLINLKRPVLHLTYDSNGGEEPSRVTDYYYMNNNNIGIGSTSKYGRKFLGWSANKNTTTPTFYNNTDYQAWNIKSYSEGSSFKDQYATLYAVYGDYYWTTVNFYSDNTTLAQKNYITYDNVLVKSKYTANNPNKDVSEYNSYVPTKEGAKFTGWNTSVNGKGDTVIIKERLSANGINANGVSNKYWQNGKWMLSISSDNSIDLYPMWNTKKATITYNDNYSEKTEKTIIDSADVNNIRVNMFRKDGFVFTGWNTKPDGSGTDYSEGQSLGHYPNIDSTENEDITLYAQWVKSEYYKTMLFENKNSIKVIPPKYLPLSEETSFVQDINIDKIDTDHEVVPGTVFDVECDDGSVTTVTTDENGKTTASFEYSVTTDDLGKKYWYCTNYDELDDFYKQQVAESENYVNEAEARVAAKADLDEYIKTFKKNYTIKEVSHPDYVGTADDVKISLVGDKASQDVQIVDSLEVEAHSLQNECTLTPVFKIRKTNAMDEILPGVKINIYADADKKNLLVEGITDENGEIYYEGTPVTYKTDEYKYVDVDAYGTASNRLKQYCQKHGYYTSYEEALTAYKNDKNYKIVNGHDDDNENPLASREKEMERTYYYQELSTLDGYKLDGELHKVTVFWFKSDDINNNLITNANRADIEITNPEDDVNADGDPVDYATKFINYQKNKLMQVTDEESFTQNLTIIKNGTLGNVLPNATFDVTVNGVTKQFTTNAEGKINISTTFTTHTADEYYYIENLKYVSEDEVNEILRTSTETKHIFRTEEEAKNAARAEVESKRDRAYHIHEVTPPTGYKACADADVTISYNDSKEITLIDENTASIRLIKNDSKKAPVENAKFGVFTTDEAYKNNESYSYKGDTYYLLKDVNTDRNGEAIIEGLNPDGKTKYIVIEKVTKAGKILLAEPIDVGTLPVILDTAPDNGYKGTVVESNGKYHYFDITYTVTNDSVFELPKTGATTTYWYLAGLLIVLAGVIVMFKKKGVHNYEKK